MEISEFERLQNLLDLKILGSHLQLQGEHKQPNRHSRTFFNMDDLFFGKILPYFWSNFGTVPVRAGCFSASSWCPLKSISTCQTQQLPLTSFSSFLFIIKHAKVEKLEEHLTFSGPLFVELERV